MLEIGNEPNVSVRFDPRFEQPVRVRFGSVGFRALRDSSRFIIQMGSLLSKYHGLGLFHSNERKYFQAEVSNDLRFLAASSKEFGNCAGLFFTYDDGKLISSEYLYDTITSSFEISVLNKK